MCVRKSVQYSFVVAIMAIALAGSATWTIAGEAAGVYDEVRAASPGGRKVTVQNLILERDAFTFRLVNGTIDFLQPVEGRTIGAVFQGRGHFALMAVDPREQHHLGFTSHNPDATGFADSFETAVFLFTDKTAEEILAHGELQEGTLWQSALGVLDKHRERQREEVRTNFHIRIVEDLLNGTPPSDGVFLAFMDFKLNPPSLAAVDPLGVEHLGLGLNTHEEALLYFMGKHNRGSIFASHLMSELADGSDTDCRPKSYADALHYNVETKIGGDHDIHGTTRITFKALQDGLRVLPIDLMSYLRLESVRLESVNAETRTDVLGFVQEDKDEDADAVIFLPEGITAGDELVVALKYQEVNRKLGSIGREVLVDAGEGNFFVLARSSWYPNLGVFEDYATYDLTFTFPKGMEIVGVGEFVGTTDQGGRTVSRWKVDSPIPVAGFNYGRFRRFEQKVEQAGLTVEVYTNPGTPDIVKQIEAFLGAQSRSAGRGFASSVTQGGGYDGYVPGSSGPSESFKISTEGMANDLMADGVNATQIFTEKFGPLPHSRVVLAQQSQWFFGQSWPTLIYMPFVAMLDGTSRAKIGLAGISDFIQAVGPHEVAHQWWGNSVSAESYRDVWLEEGFSEFSAGLVLELVEGQKAADHFWDEARKRINEGSATVRNYDAGPITLGRRIGNNRSPGAYRAMVYSKGGFVLHMLRMMMRDRKAPDPDADFFAMMKEFYQTYAGGLASTDDFQRMAEKHMTGRINAGGNGKLDWFFDQWVHGMEIPKYSMESRISKAGRGKYRFQGQLSQEGVSENFMALVPLYISFGKDKYMKVTDIPMKGSMTRSFDQTIELPKKPKEMIINAHNEVLSLE